jgi:hypothetical protein
VARTHKAAIAFCAINFVTISAEAYFFSRRAFRPLGSLVFQTAKLVVVVGLWMVMVIHGKDGQEITRDAWMVLFGEALLFAVLR